MVARLRRRNGRMGAKDDSPDPKGEAVALSTVSTRRIVKVVDTVPCGRKRYHLASLGLTPGAELKVCCNLGGPMVVEVRGSRLSLGHRIAEKIMVFPVGEAKECDCAAGAVCERAIEDDKP